jgi:ribose-phosphate pyrophosphokinase
VIARWLGRGGGRTLLVGPDEESEPWVRSLSEIAGLPWVVGCKGRTGDRRVRIRLPALPSASRAVIVDDIASSGATIAEAARGLRRGGIASVDAVVVHAIFAAGALARIRRAGVREIVSCDTIEHATNALAMAAELARALGRLER